MPAKRHFNSILGGLLMLGWICASAGIAITLLELRMLGRLRVGHFVLLCGLGLILLSLIVRKTNVDGAGVIPNAERQDVPESDSPETGLDSISFVAPQATAAKEKPLAVSALRVVSHDSIRFVIYRLELGTSGVRAIYSNQSVQNYSWLQFSAILIRQLPMNSPWDGKLMLDLVPIAPAGGTPRPLRLLSTTYVNYSMLPQGQSSSSRENLRRLGLFLAAQNPSIFVDPASTAFFNHTGPPVRFHSMAQFAEYDSQYA